MSDSKRVMSEKPLNAETPVPRLRSWITPNEVFFDRNQGAQPDPKIDLQKWRLTVTGMVRNKLTLSYEEISKMPKATEANTLECSGNSRSLLEEKASGNPLDHWRGGQRRLGWCNAGPHSSAGRVQGWCCPCCLCGTGYTFGQSQNTIYSQHPH